MVDYVRVTSVDDHSCSYAISRSPVIKLQATVCTRRCCFNQYIADDEMRLLSWTVRWA